MAPSGLRTAGEGPCPCPRRLVRRVCGAKALASTHAPCSLCPQIRKLSVKKIVSPIIFDNSKAPVEGGLYDPALGPLDSRERCVWWGGRCSHGWDSMCGDLDTCWPVDTCIKLPANAWNSASTSGPAHCPAQVHDVRSDHGLPRPLWAHRVAGAGVQSPRLHVRAGVVQCFWHCARQAAGMHAVLRVWAGADGGARRREPTAEGGDGEGLPCRSLATGD